MTLTDAGPLVALIDADEPDHQLCRDTLPHLERPMITTWAAFTEAMYLLSRLGDPAGWKALWRLVSTGRLRLADLSREAVARSEALMTKYADLPMDLADATLVAYAEEHDLRRVFTLDSDFQVYRRHGRTRVEVVPQGAAGYRKSR
jgi:predicted nucleic acid-binding protein